MRRIPIMVHRLTLALLILAAPQTSWGEVAAPAMKAHFIDVGQGDSTLLEFPCGAILIDAGAQDKEKADDLIKYLQRFFRDRQDLNETLEAVFITHTHIDHNYALERVCTEFKVNRYIDNGIAKGSGRFKAKWIRDSVAKGDQHAKIIAVNDEDVTKASNPAVGFTNSDIDPLKCDRCDPRVAVLSGRLNDNPGWSTSDFNNQNNQSLVIRVDFGASSFLFTGDLEVTALDTLVNYYEDEVHHREALDVDVWHVGHHGSDNGTTDSLLAATSPKLAVISMGRWDFGKDPAKAGGPFNTFNFAHPRRSVVEQLEAVIKDRRSEEIEPYVFIRAKKPVKHPVRKAIYATGWDGTIQVRADLKGKYRVNLEESAGDN